MAKVKKDTKIQRYKDTKSKIRVWLENRTKLIRSFNIPRAARATRSSRKLLRRAGRHLSLIAILIAGGIILSSFFYPKSQFRTFQEKLINNPNDIDAHLQIAEMFLGNNQLNEAERTLRLAQNLQFKIYNLQSGNKVLGEQTASELNELWRQKHYSDPNDIKKLITAWEKIVEKKPDYRDGWLQLAVLYYKLYQNDEAQISLQKAIDIDPNYEPARELEKVIL